VSGLIGFLAGGEGELEFMVVWGREKKERRLPKRGLEIHTKYGVHERKAEENLKKTLRGEKVVTLVILSEN
jgi:hypothetical protein